MVHTRRGVYIGIHIFFITLLMVPNTLFYATPNALSELLITTFKDPDLIHTSSLMHSIPSIFMSFFTSFVADMFGVQYFLIPYQVVICFGCLLIAFASNNVMFLIGRLMYGITGEGMIMLQSKLIANLVPSQWHPTAFGAAFSGFMFGEFLTSFFISRLTTVRTAYLVCFGCLLISLICCSAYTAIEIVRLRKLQEKEGSTERKRATCKELFKRQIDAIRAAPTVLWLFIVVRLIFLGSKMAFDSTSTLTLTSALNVPEDRVVFCVGIQQLTSAISFLITGLLTSFHRSGPMIAILIGFLIMLLGMISLYIFSGFESGRTFTTAICVTVFLGLSFGTFAGNASSVIVALSSVYIAATGLGIVFSLQFILMSGIVPLSNYVAKKLGSRNICWLYIGILIVAIPFLVISAIVYFRKVFSTSKSEMDLDTKMNDSYMDPQPDTSIISQRSAEMSTALGDSNRVSAQL
ncbi:Major facilitator family protein [Giardia muris]|uniref:Lysosomal dipeptide transporter MFSD1 n=1 Tax=Giardia muris TaxID=5742 RepID=A0A4Z1SX32_GIAMU|nr:Major facilitator family protein [Giardia muris]|eukprot:TNJ30276.1 Major facilitator family protein [Giardia muris]